MGKSFDLILSGGELVNHDGVALRDVGVIGGRIAEIGDLARASAGERVDCRGLTVLPGVIDSQVHFREPGLEHKEDLETGSRAAVLGGVTAVFEMPNTKPLTTTAEALADKVCRAANRMFCDFAFWVGGARDNVRRHSRARALARRGGHKGVHGLFDRLAAGRRRRGRRGDPRQDAAPRRVPLRGRGAAQRAQGFAGRGDPSSHPVWRDEISALRATERLVRLAREKRAQVHVLHVSTRQEIDFLAGAKDVASCEATPHHLTLAADDYPRLGTRMQMNPPVRDNEHRDGDMARRRRGDHRRPRLRPRAAHARREVKALPREPLGHDGRADARPDHARPRRGGAAHACSASST